MTNPYKSVKQTLTLFFILITLTSSSAVFTGVYQVGNSAPLYTKLSQVADSLFNSTVTGNVIFELQADYDGSTGEIFPISFRQYNVSGGSWTVTIRPAAGVTGRITSGDPGSGLPLIQFNGIDNLILDGRAGGIGSSEWTIRNTRTLSVVGPAISLINDATFNTLKYLSIEGQSPASTGLILFSTSTGTTGNSNNSINFNTIHDRTDVAAPLGIGIYSAGSVTARNKNNTIDNNHIYNWSNFGINITPTGNGEGWTISNNNFYNTLSANTSSQTSIQFLAGASSFSNFITSNIIGGQTAGASGSPWINSSAAAFNGIIVNTGISTSTVISNNVVKNINLTSTSIAAFTGISCTAGSVNILDNTIGSSTSSDGISSSGSSTVTGINISTAGTAVVQNNYIGNLLSSGLSTGAQLRGIVSSGTGSSTVSSNTITQLSGSSSSISNTTAALSGIYINSAAASQIYSFNSVSGLRSLNGTANTNVPAITINNGSGLLLSNRIFDISNSSTGTSAAVIGIYIGTGNWDLVNNMISISNSFANDVSVKGIWDNNPSGGDNYYYNTIYISGSGNTTNSTYALLRSGNTSVNIKNNFLYNSRTGTMNFALGNTAANPANGWPADASNNNFFVTAQSSVVNNWNNLSVSFINWKTESQSDVFSYYSNSAAIPSSVFINPAAGNLKINPTFASAASNLESRGRIIAGYTTDFENDVRPGPAGSVNGGAFAPDIGADEFDGVPYIKDVGITALAAPSPLSCPGSSQLVQFTLTNFGQAINLSTDNITISSSVTGPNALTFSPVILNSGTLAGGASMTITVSGSYNMSASGTYTFYANSVVAGDSYINNDSLPPVSISLTQIVTLPTSVSFSGYSGLNLNTVFPDWMESSGLTPTGNTSLWTSQANMNAAGNTSARINLYSTGKREWIVGPKFQAGPTTKLRFSAAVTAKNSVVTGATMGSDDAVQVMLSTDCGQSWFPVYTMNNLSNLPLQLTSQVVPLDMYSGQRILVAFYATDGTVDNIEDYDFHIDNVIISDNINGFDLGVTALLNPLTTGCYSSNDTIKVTLRNFGPETINFASDNATITANVNGPLNQVFTKTLNSGTMAPWSSMTVVVTSSLNLSTPGTYSIAAYSTIIPDYDSTNNAMVPQIRTNSFPMTLPDYVDFTGFTGANLSSAFPNWEEATGTTPTGSTSSWLSQTGLNSPGNITARVNLLGTTKREWLVSKKFVPTSSTQLKFFAAVTNGGSTTVGDIMGSDDAVTVMISTNCGVSWFPSFALNASSNLSTTLQPFSVNLGMYAGSEIMVAFLATDGPVDNAETYDFHLDNIEIRDFLPIDLGARVLVSPVPNACTDNSETIVIGIKNFGTDTIDLSITSLNLGVTISGSSSQSFNTVVNSGIIYPDSVFNAIATTSANFTNSGTHVINATVSIAGDGNNSNNSFISPVNYIATTVSNFPYTESFETTVAGWSVSQLAGTGQWSYLSGGGTNPTLSPFNGSKMAFFNSNANTFAGAVSRLTTSCLNLSNLNSPRLEFYLSQNNSYQFNKDSLFVVVSTDAGLTWSQSLLSVSRYNSTYSTPGWKKFSVCLDQYAGMPGIKIGFIAKSAFGSNIFLDAVTISETPQPVSGFISSSANLLCGGMNTFLNLYSYSGNIQWQQSADNITFYNIAGATLDTLTSPAISDTTYFRVITSINSVCVATDSSASIQVDVLPAPQIALGSDTVICANNYLLDAGPQNAGTSFQWNDGSSAQTLLATTSGQYYIVGTSQFFCQTRDTINITFKTPVVLNASPDQTICEGDNTILSATGGFSYLWNTSETTSSVIVNPLSDSIYTVTAFGTNGCTATDSIIVYVNQNPIVDLGADTTLCGGSLVLNGGSASNTYNWSNGATTPSINVSSGGQYFVEATSINGCISSDTIIVSISPAVTVNLGSDINQCGGNVTLNAGNPGSSYNWSNGSVSQTIVVNSSGTYYTAVTNSSGCSDTDTIQVTINPNPVVDLGADIQSCSSSVNLTTSASGNYIWNTGATTSGITVNTSGTYSVSVDLNGCVVSDTISVIISNPPFVNLGADIQSCSSSIILDAGNSGSMFLWNTGATGQTLTVITSGTYFVNVTASGGCTVADSILVTINPTVAANAGPDLSVCSGNSVQLSASGGTNYLWNNTLSGANITVTPVSDTIFTVVVTDINGCTGTDQLNVFVNEGPTSVFSVFAAGTSITTNNNSLNANSVVWDFGDGSAFNTSFAPSHTYMSNGTYVISLITSNSCGTDTATYVLSVVGTEEEELLSNSVKLFPVPTSGILNAEISAGLFSTISIKLITPDGRLIDEKNFSDTSAVSASFDLTELSSGIYFMQISNERTIVNKKIILQK
jgi:hypothetical protein